jgi:hypothetical protein
LRHWRVRRGIAYGAPRTVMDQNPSLLGPPVPPQCGKCQKPMGFMTTILRVTEPGRVRIFQCSGCENWTSNPRVREPHGLLSGSEPVVHELIEDNLG